MDSLKIDGGVPLTGEIHVSGAKNAALPLMAAGLVTDGTLRLTNVPDLVDTRSMEVLLGNHGLDVTRDGDVVQMSGDVTNIDAPYDLVRKMRASILVLGPLLARHGQARVSLPGGCAIGTRPVDLHIRAMQALGAVVELADGYIQARAPSVSPARGWCSRWSRSAPPKTRHCGDAGEGHLGTGECRARTGDLDLAECLKAMGARITGHGTDMITVEGVESLGDAEHAVIPDRIEAGTFAIAALITRGDLTLTGAKPAISTRCCSEGNRASISVENDGMRIAANGAVRAADITTDPYPGFPPTPGASSWPCALPKARRAFPRRCSRTGSCMSRN